MRGKAEPMQIVTDLIRITPAYAGKRWKKCRRKLDGLDHPRLCGEKPRSCKTSVSRPGSPPPMRGKVRAFFHFVFLN